MSLLHSQERWRELFTLRFYYRVFSAFWANQGLLLAGAMAFYTLLSIIPLFALLLIALSRFVSADGLLLVVKAELEVIAPGGAKTILEEIQAIIAYRKVVGPFGVGVLLFFGSLAFSVVEKAMAVIFHHRRAVHKRSFITSVILPFLYVGGIAIAMVAVTVATSFVHALSDRALVFRDTTISLDGASALGLHVIVWLSEMLMLASLYIVLPIGRGSWKHAIVGGAFATLLWEITRRGMAWYFATISMVNAVYGSLASTILALFAMEAASIIILLGAQVIAVYEQIPKMNAGQNRSPPVTATV